MKDFSDKTNEQLAEHLMSMPVEERDIEELTELLNRTLAKLIVDSLGYAQTLKRIVKVMVAMHNGLDVLWRDRFNEPFDLDKVDVPQATPPHVDG